MTMFPPAQYYQSRQQLIYNHNHECLYSSIHSCYLNDEEAVRSSTSFAASDHIISIMADQEDKSSTSNNIDQEAERDHEEWLQLSIGGGGGGGGTQHHQVDTRSRRSLSSGGGGGGNINNLVELDLLNQQQQQQQHVFRPPPSSSLPMFNMPGYRIPAPNIFNMLMQQQGPTSRLYNNMAAATTSFGPNPPQEMANWAALRPTATFVPRPYNNYHIQAGGPSSEGRLVLIDPPRNRPHSGIWFMLQASQFQGREPYLPQISKSYLRIKDGRMTVRFIMKYVANKLRLDSESEIEITCRGQHLVPFLTLQHVRDNIWINQRDTPTTTIALLPHSSTEDHVMVLRYGRTP